ncbi:MAG: segregation/condensation protein A [Anaerolineae bacterium]|jgi:segregation and condensation protein A
MPLITQPIQLPVFEGPLDLLLKLIERQELDITAISLAQVTDQYLAIIEEMGRRGMSDLAAFLVVAAKLMLIKSRALLPRPSSEEAAEEDDVATDLISQLEEYRRFKRVAQELSWREQEGLHSYIRISPPISPQPTSFDLAEVTLEGLLAAAQEALNALPASRVEEVMSPITITVADQTSRIQERLARQGRIEFRDVLSDAANVVEIIVTLLAVLELLKQDQVQAWQEQLFGPIFIERRRPDATAPDPSLA